MASARWWIYLLECERGYLYAGSTSDMARRWREHLSGSARCKFTRSFRPLRIAQCWSLNGSRGTALRIEEYIKRGGRRFKLELLAEPCLLGARAKKELGVRARITPEESLRIGDGGVR